MVNPSAVTLIGVPCISANIYCKSRNLPRYSQLQYRFAVICEAPSTIDVAGSHIYQMCGELFHQSFDHNAVRWNPSWRTGIRISAESR